MTSADEGALTPDFVVWVARRVVAQHAEEPHPDRATGRCAQCLPEGPCPLLVWAGTQVTSLPPAAGRV
ncbi:MAG TPA: hypothetical protein VF755_19745 [Catenuloplanes sp.]